MMLRQLIKKRSAAGLALAKRTFTHLTNYEETQPPKEGSVTDYMLDTRMANSKYYNPHSFDP